MGKRKKEELPDYTVANMDVDGMPWNSRRPWQILPGDPSKSRKEFDVKVPEPGMENEVPDELSAFQNPPMTKEERRGTESEEHQKFIARTEEKKRQFEEKYHLL